MEYCHKVKALLIQLRTSGHLTGGEQRVTLNGRAVHAAHIGDFGACAALATNLMHLAAFDGDPHVRYDRATDEYSVGRHTRETRLADVTREMESLSRWDQDGADDFVTASLVRELTPAVAAKLLLDAAEAKKLSPAKPASPIATSSPLTIGDRNALLDPARKWEDA
ncbi:MAG TPA: hypothetical protein VFZ61_33705 [Polyangiales bacterium]